MLRITLKGLLAHKLRLVLTALSVVLGVAFVAGSLILGDTLNRTFDNLFATAYSGTDVGVRGKAAFEASAVEGGDPTQTRAPVPEDVLGIVTGVPGVAEAAGDYYGFAQIVAPDGTAVETSGAPTFGGAWLGTSRLNPYKLVDGKAPAGPGQVAIDAETATGADITVGDRITVLTETGQREAVVSGVVGFGAESGSLAGATVTLFDPATAETALGTDGAYSEILAVGDGSVSDAELRDRVAAVLPAGVAAYTGEQLGEMDASDIQEGLGFFTTFLLVFAAIAVFVGSFIIFNTFTMLVAQRTRELALLRALGASRHQVNRAVLTEAAAVGIVGSTLGLGLGVGLAVALRELIDALLGSLPAGGLVFQANTVVWSYVVGVVVTVVAAVAPARRATRIAPVAALRDDVAMPVSSLHRRAVVGVVLAGLGVAGMTAGLLGEAPLLVLGIGALLVFVGAASLSPFASRPVVGGLGRLLPRVWGTTGRLARENALRNPRRTAATASALMVGLALVSAVGVLSASLVTSANAIIDRSVGADFIVTTANFMPVPGGTAEAMRSVDGVAAVTSFRAGQAEVGGRVTSLQGVTADTVDQTLQLDVTAGELSALAEGMLLADEDLAKDRGWAVGDTLPVVYGRTGASEVVLGGTYAENQIAGPFLVSLETFDANFASNLDQVVAMNADPDADLAAVRRGIEAVAAGAGGLQVRDQSEFKQEQRDQINQLLGFVLVLLALAVLIAALGIVNTLALSVIERTREVGLLRAVGMSRVQVRRMIRLEAVVIAVFGTLLGLVLGIAYGVSFVRALADEGIDQLSIPWGQLVAYLVVGGLIGVLAAIWPARRASRLDVLKAITTE